MTTRQHLTALLAEPLVLEAVISSHTGYAGRFNWRRGQTADELVEALARARCLRKALAVALWATGALIVLRAAAWPAQARTFRHLAHVAMAADRDEPSPIRTTLTADELRVRRQAAALGVLKGDSK